MRNKSDYNDKQRSLLRLLIVWVTVFVATLFLMEIALHIFLFGFMPKPSMIIADKGPKVNIDLVFQLKSEKNIKTKFMSPLQRNYEHAFSINKRGYRGDLVDYNDKRPKIVVLGDSFTFGVGVNDNETYSSCLETLLKNKFAVINLGVPAYNTSQEVEFFLREGVRYNPRIVIVGYTGDDHKPIPFKRRDIFMSRLSNIYLAYLYVKPVLLKTNSENESDYDYQTVHDGLAALKELSIQKNFDLLAVLLDRGGSYSSTLNYCEENKINYIDISLEIFRTRNFIPKDGHPDKKGHQLIAVSILNKLSEIWNVRKEFTR